MTEIKCYHCQNDDDRLMQFLLQHKSGYRVFYCEVCGREFTIVETTHITIQIPEKENGSTD